MTQATQGLEGFTSGRGQVDALERYYTPDDLAAFVVGLLPPVATVLEPHAGGGAFLRALETAGPRGDLHVKASDIRPRPTPPTLEGIDLPPGERC